MKAAVAMAKPRTPTASMIVVLLPAAVSVAFTGCRGSLNFGGVGGSGLFFAGEVA